MLAHLLAVVVGLGSVALYLAAFFFPEVHRKHDFFWSGVGCFYALVLWVDASQLSATELLGHTASIALVARFSWQTLTLRRKRTPRDLQTPLTDQSWQTFAQEITALGMAWLRRTPLGKLLPQPAAKQSSPSPGSGSLRASSLKQVDYEFVDDLPPSHATPPQESFEPSPLQNQPTSSEPDPHLNQSASSQQNSGGATTPQRQKSAPDAPKKPNSKTIQKPNTLLQKGIVLKDWLVEVVTAAAKPKPKKPVIVIPPRSSQPETPSETRVPATSRAPSGDEVSETSLDQPGTVGTRPDDSIDNWSEFEAEENSSDPAVDSPKAEEPNEPNP